jgi:hypothetical protein
VPVALTVGLPTDVAFTVVVFTVSLAAPDGIPILTHTVVESPEATGAVVRVVAHVASRKVAVHPVVMPDADIV